MNLPKIQPCLFAVCITLATATPIVAQAIAKLQDANTISVFRQNSNGYTSWWVDSPEEHGYDPKDLVYWFGLNADQPIMGDWQQKNHLQTGIFRNGYWYVDYDDNHMWDSGDAVYSFGLSGDIPVVGDWDQKGKLRIGVFRVDPNSGLGYWYVDTQGCLDPGGCNYDPNYTSVFQFGAQGDIPVVGDWDNSGVLRIGVYRPSTGQWIVNTTTQCQNNISTCNDYWTAANNGKIAIYYFAPFSAGQPITGIWNAGAPGFPANPLSLGMFDPNSGQWTVDSNNNNQLDGGDASFSYGLAGDIAVMSPPPPPTICGQVLAGGSGIAGVTMNLSGSNSAEITTGGNGDYCFSVSTGGTYTVTPSFPNLIFSPASASFSNLSQNQQQSFTAMPPTGYTDGSGPATIPDSFTALAPAMSCTDISGNWNDADDHGNSIGWNLTQSGSSVSGTMAYEAWRQIDGYWQDCGTINYTATGQEFGTSFSLSASINGTPIDECGYAVQTSETETVNLSGQACGSGAATYTIYSGSGGGTAATKSAQGSVTSPAITANSASVIPILRRVAKSNTGNSQPPNKAGTSTYSASAVRASAFAADSTSGSSTWTTTTPRFTIQYASYIPVDHIFGPTGCLATTTIEAYGTWLIYKGDAFRGTYRTTQSLLAFNGMDNPQGDGWFAETGATRNYGWPSSPANGSTLSSSPTGDIYNDPYTGADEDNASGDCYLWNAKGHASTADMQGHSVSAAGNWLDVNMYGVGRDPLELQMGGIDWNITTSVNTANPEAYVSFSHTCYPAHIVKVNGTTVYSYQPPYNNTLYIVACLTQTEPLVTGDTSENPTVVPPY